MSYDAQGRYWRSLRLKGYDYAQPGAYFVTIVTQGRASSDERWDRLANNFERLFLSNYGGILDGG
jgi:hypothetical protein